MILWDLFVTFLKIGIFTFGGGYAMIPLIQSEVVDGFRWLTMKQFVDLVALAEMTPGPLALNSATFVGYLVAGLPGSVMATLALVIPSYAVMLAVQAVYSRIKGRPLVRAAFKGINAAVLGLIVVAALSLGRTSIVDWGTALIALVLVIAIARFRVHPVLALIVAGMAGFLLFR
jgi:chromate transporter